MIHKTPFIILNGFDRSGTSMIAKVLAKHPEVELLFQPDNSTILHRTQWEYWPPDYSCPEAEGFFQGLLSGYVDQSFIQSDWFENHSTTYDVVPGRLHAIKSTKLHFKFDWLRGKFPQIEFYGIIRDPRATVCSLVRNGFHQSWYGEAAYRELVKYCDTDQELNPALKEQVHRAADDLEKIAAIVAVRTDVMMRSVPSNRVLTYEKILATPNEILNEILEPYELPWFDFTSYMKQDYNPVGQAFEKAELWQDFFRKEDIERLEAMFRHANAGLDPITEGGH